MKTVILLLTLMGLVMAGPLRAQVDCSVTQPRPLSGAQVLGNGSPGSVNTSQIQAALDQGGAIRFDVGPNPVQINLTQTLVVSRSVVLDGGGLVTLSGQDQRRIMLIENPNNLFYTVTLQNLSFIGGNVTQSSGAAVFKPSGGPWQAVSLEVINSHFTDNHAIQVEQDGGGGAIYGIGMADILISHSSFTGNSGSNGGAFYSLGSEVIRITDSLFDGNTATGNSGNPGNGGNAGAIGIDGAERTFSLCRSQVVNNQANAFGVGFFSVMYDQLSHSGFVDVLFENNQNPQDFGLAGGAYIQGGPFTIEGSSFIDNQARGAGGIFFGPGANGEMVNSTVYGNMATNTLGGGMSIDGSAVITLRHVTVVNNHAPCSVCFAGGISIGGSNQTTLVNSILANNTGGNVFNPWNILNPVSGSDNLQFPMQRPNGQTEVAATPALIWLDPLLSPPADNGGPTPTLASAVNSPGNDTANSGLSVATDQRGYFRDATPDMGAYEWLEDLIFADGFD
jgi:hypothetical protein